MSTAIRGLDVEAVVRQERAAPLYLAGHSAWRGRLP